jgi:hypothetical protein
MPLNTELWLHPEAFASSAILVGAATVEIHNRPVFAVTGVREEPGKQKPQSCRALELARSPGKGVAEKGHLPKSVGITMRRRVASAPEVETVESLRIPSVPEMRSCVASYRRRDPRQVNLWAERSCKSTRRIQSVSKACRECRRALSSAARNSDG